MFPIFLGLDLLKNYEPIYNLSVHYFWASKKWYLNYTYAIFLFFDTFHIFTDPSPKVLAGGGNREIVSPSPLEIKRW